VLPLSNLKSSNFKSPDPKGFNHSAQGSVALRSPNRGGAVARDHARALNSAFEFWGVGFLDAGRKAASTDTQKQFEEILFPLMEDIERVQKQFPEGLDFHYVTF
jgi:hypothetical protein